MLKRIKFNVLLGDKYCKNLEEVKNNFNIHDILYYFDKGTLEKWLEVQNLKDMCEKVSKIDKNANTLKKIDSLIDIFYEDENNKESIKEMHKEAAYIMGLENKKRDDLEILSKNAFKEKEVIDNYFKNYEYIINMMQEKKEDYDLIKSLVKNIQDNFLNLFVYDFNNFFMRLKAAKCIFGILSVFANEKTRKYFLNNDNIMKETSKIFSYYTENPSNDMNSFYNNNFSRFWGGINNYSSSNNTNKNNSNKKTVFTIFDQKIEDYKYLENRIKVYSKTSDNIYSTVIENKKYLILCANSNITITSSEDKNKSYTYKDINNKFLILDGINLQSVREFAYLVYMEI